MCAWFSSSGLELAFHLLHNTNQVLYLTSTSQTSVRINRSVSQIMKVSFQRYSQLRDEMDTKKTATFPGQAEVMCTSLSSIYKAHLLAA